MSCVSLSPPPLPPVGLQSVQRLGHLGKMRPSRATRKCDLAHKMMSDYGGPSGNSCRREREHKNKNDKRREHHRQTILTLAKMKCSLPSSLAPSRMPMPQGIHWALRPGPIGPFRPIGPFLEDSLEEVIGFSRFSQRTQYFRRTNFTILF